MTTAALADLCEVITDGTHTSPTRTDVGHPVLSAQNVRSNGLDLTTSRFTTDEELAAFERRFKPRGGDVLMTIVGTIGRVAVLESPPNAVFQRSVAFLRPDPKRLDPRYLAWATQSPAFQSQLAQATNTSSQAGVYLGRLKAIEIPIVDLFEQRRIAAILDRADALRAKRRQVLDHLDSLTQSIFTEMFAGASGGHVPLSHLASLVTKGTTPTSVGLRFSAAGVPFLRAQNLQRGTVVFGPGDWFIDADADSALKRSRIVPRDLLISIAGTIGRVALVPDESPTMNCNQAVAIVRLIDPATGPWLRAWLASSDAVSQIGASAVTGTISNLSLGQIRQLKVPVVSAHEIENFNRRSASVEAQQDAVAKAGAVAHELFTSLQSRAFRGEL